MRCGLEILLPHPAAADFHPTNPTDAFELDVALVDPVHVEPELVLGHHVVEQPAQEARPAVERQRPVVERQLLEDQQRLGHLVELELVDRADQLHREEDLRVGDF